MPTSAIVSVETKVSGLPEGGSDQNRYSLRLSSAVSVSYETTIGTGISSATTLSNPVGSRVMLLQPFSSNTNPYRLAMSTAEVGLPLSSQDISLFSMPDSTAASTFYLWTTSTRAFGLRARFL